MRSLVVLVLASCFLSPLAVPRAARAQVSTSLRGRVVSEVEGRPVARIRLRFDNGATALSDGAGRFVVDGLPPGEHRVTLITPTCRKVSGVVWVEAATTWETHLSLPEELALADFGPDFEPGQGRVLTAAEIEAGDPSTLAEVIRRVAPEMVEQAGNQPGETTSLKGRNTATVGGRTEPVLVLDGILQGNASGILKDVRPEEISAIQILPGASGGWVYGTSGGMIRIWTKRGRAAGAAGGPVDCSEYRGSGDGV